MLRGVSESKQLVGEECSSLGYPSWILSLVFDALLWCLPYLSQYGYVPQPVADADVTVEGSPTRGGVTTSSSASSFLQQRDTQQVDDGKARAASGVVEGEIDPCSRVEVENIDCQHCSLSRESLGVITWSDRVSGMAA